MPGHQISVVKQRGREKGARGPGPEWFSVLSIGVIGKSAPEIGDFLRRNFWMISGGPFLPLGLLPRIFGNGPNTASDSNTELSEFFDPRRVPGRELSFQPIIYVPKQTHRVSRRTH